MNPRRSKLTETNEVEKPSVKKTKTNGVVGGLLPALEPVSLLPAIDVTPKGINVYKVTDTATLPEYATPGSTCFDFHANLVTDAEIVVYDKANQQLKRKVQVNQKGENFILITPGDRVLIPSGLIFDVPEGYGLKIYSRSGNALKRSLVLGNDVAVIDADYVNETFVMLSNHSSKTLEIVHGERVAQGEFALVTQFSFTETKEAPQTKTNRNGGFGSTGTK